MKKVQFRISESDLEILKNRSKESTAQGALTWLLKEERRLMHKVINLEIKASRSAIMAQREFKKTSS